MSLFAVVQNGVVVNTIIADSIKVAHLVTNSECVEYDSSLVVSIGDTYDAELDIFEAPYVVPIEVVVDPPLEVTP